MSHDPYPSDGTDILWAVLHTHTLVERSFVTVVISLCWWVCHDDLHTRVWGVVRSLALLPIAVPDIVGILLVKL